VIVLESGDVALSRKAEREIRSAPRIGVSAISCLRDWAGVETVW
jgi:hypothetical protein